MEEVILMIVNYVIGLADKHHYIATFCLIIGGLYVALYALRGLLTALVKLTKTDKDDKVVATIFAFCDKYSYGFGPFAEYFETHTKKKGK